MVSLRMHSVFSVAKILAASLLCSEQSLAFIANPSFASTTRVAAYHHLSSRSPDTDATFRMSVGYAPQTVQAAWDNHFSAFGAQDVDQILLDYDDNSQVVTYDHATGDKNVYMGVEGARSLFTGLFAALKDTSDLAAPVIDVAEDSKMVFLIWSCAASGFPSATDTFVFSDNMKIYRQNVAFTTASA